MNQDEARDRLGEERERLTAMRSDPGTETFKRERDLSILDDIDAELADVEHALRRLDDGSYGTCETCAQPISRDRLEAAPAARFCVDHQAVAERETGRA